MVGESFLEALFAAANEAAAQALVEERMRLLRAAGRLNEAGAARPRSRPQNEVYAPAPGDMKGFVAAIT